MWLPSPLMNEIKFVYRLQNESFFQTVKTICFTNAGTIDVTANHAFNALDFNAISLIEGQK
jgi:hypothetical protein